ncbi:MAG: LamG domain-containing protein [Deltaproteobacteria bacterium]|nr:LamG domain-containing protein [Deltaproteobacteria bacterium]
MTTTAPDADPSGRHVPPVITLNDHVVVPVLMRPITLTATVTDDGLGDAPLRFSWRRRSGPADVLPLPPDAAATQVTFKVAGLYAFEFTVFEGQETVSAMVEVEVLDLEDRLIAHWPFNDQGNLATDVSGQSGRALALHDTRWQGGAIRGALSLNGGMDWGEVLGAQAASFAFNTGDFAVSLWVRTKQRTLASQVPQIVRYAGDSATGYHGWELSLGVNGFLELKLSEAGQTTGVGRAGLNDNAWHHVVGQRRSGELQFWIDTKFLAQRSAPFAILEGDGLIVGGGIYGDTTNFDGAVDDLRIFSRALSDREIAALGNAALVAQW